MKIGVIMGGISSERDISLNTGKEIIANLNKEKYQVVPIVIDKRRCFSKAKDLDLRPASLTWKVWKMVLFRQFFKL